MAKKVTQQPATTISKTEKRKSWHNLPADFRGTGTWSGDFKKKDVSG